MFFIEIFLNLKKLCEFFASPIQSIHQCVQNAALQLSLKITENDQRGETVSECFFFGLVEFSNPAML